MLAQDKKLTEDFVSVESVYKKQILGKGEEKSKPNLNV